MILPPSPVLWRLSRPIVSEASFEAFVEDQGLRSETWLSVESPSQEDEQLGGYR